MGKMAKPSDDLIVTPAGLLATAGAAKGPPPVHLWNPPWCGRIDMRIARDGTWFHEGSPIGRPAMVRLFSGILRRDDDGYVLVTPVEKVGITVDDLPLHIVDVEAEGAGQAQTLTFRTKTDDIVVAGPANPIAVDIGPDGSPAPRVHVRRDLWARVDRKTFYRMIDLGAHAVHEGQRWFGLWSGGQFFPVVPSDELPPP
jgi:uncharacterized protein